MRILVIGSNAQLEELKSKMGSDHEYDHALGLVFDLALEDFDLIFDFLIDSSPDNFEQYMDLVKPNVLLNTVKISLAELQYTFGSSSAEIYGFNGLLTFIDRNVWEISSFNKTVSDSFSNKLGEYILVDDRVGLVTPRIILMIINEAYYTVQERTASRQDIDQAMKLGTNYPHGPFEWLDKIGIEDVYETLEAIYNDTNDERYKIAPLLKKEYLQLNR